MIRAKTPYDRGTWTVLLLLLLAVLIPTACVLWFMSLAVRNERLAVRQKLTDTYRSQLVRARQALDDDWRQRAADLMPVSPNAAETFAALVRADKCDGAVIYDTAGTRRYPKSPPVSAAAAEANEAWKRAAALERDGRDLDQAIRAYAALARSDANRDIRARALVGQARCLARTGAKPEAIRILTGVLPDTAYAGSVDAQGRLIVPNAQLLALQVIHDTADKRYRATARRLAECLNSYTDSAMSASQRTFLMDQLVGLGSRAATFPTLAAEHLTAAYLETGPPSRKHGLARTPVADLWQLTSPNRTIVGLLRDERVRSVMQSTIDREISLPHAHVSVQPRRADTTAFLTLPAGPLLPDWELALDLLGPSPFDTAAKRQIATYLWTGLVVVVAIALLALLVAWHIGRQVKQTRLKNDLLATVSHELKTPLSSIRLLVDTLLAKNGRDSKQTREYLELIARENRRLTRLIDKFLTFSRMERSKQAFVLSPVRPEEVVREAEDAVRERFEAAGCRLDVDLPPGLPEIHADRDALATVLINLLDNAYKYSRQDRHITLRCFATNDMIHIEVADNGIGMSRSETKRVFDRFYQVDRTLARTAEGCGLGLSIVQFIVKAHKGSVDVRSQSGEGSTFTVLLPVGAPSVTAEK